jgi:hypothetical protein
VHFADGGEAVGVGAFAGDETEARQPA